MYLWMDTYIESKSMKAFVEMIQVNLVPSHRHEIGRNGKLWAANLSGLVLDPENTIDVS